MSHFGKNPNRGGIPPKDKISNTRERSRDFEEKLILLIEDERGVELNHKIDIKEKVIII